jgi:phospholipid/cholesterol/gamma-HCH transport system substrate-binding protein
VNRRTAFNLAFFTLVAAAFFVWALTNLVKVNAIKRPYNVRATFASAVGLLPNSEVDYLGVTYGTVGSVKRVDGGAEVTMKINRGKKIPLDSQASIFRKSALGEQYIEFTPPDGYKGGGPFYPKDASIPMSRTTVPLEFSELLRSASRLISAIPPDAAGSLVHELAVGLAGRSDSLRQLAEAGDQLGATLASRTSALDRLAANNTRLTHVVTDNRDAFGRSLTDLRQLADSLKTARGDTSVLLVRGSQLLQETADLVAAHKGDLDCDLKTLELVTDTTTTPARLADVATVLDVAPTAFDDLLDATDVDTNAPIGPQGRWIRVGFKLNLTHNPPPQFNPPHVLPDPRVVPACDSPLRPAVGDYRPIVASSPDAAGAEQPTAWRLALILGLVALTAGVALRQSGSPARG